MCVTNPDHMKKIVKILYYKRIRIALNNVMTGIIIDWQKNTLECL